MTIHSHIDLWIRQRLDRTDDQLVEGLGAYMAEFCVTEPEMREIVTAIRRTYDKRKQ